MYKMHICGKFSKNIDAYLRHVGIDCECLCDHAYDNDVEGALLTIWNLTNFLVIFDNELFFCKTFIAVCPEFMVKGIA